VSYLPVGFMECACFVYEVIAIREGWLTLLNHNLSVEKRLMTLFHTWSRDLLSVC